MTESRNDTAVLRSRIEDGLTKYYTRYYRDTLSLPDWDQRIGTRLDEENIFGRKLVERIESWYNYDFSGKRLLVVGAGTGAEAFFLHKKGADIYGIEPDQDAMDILHLKADLHDLPTDRFAEAKAEDIPHEDEKFDFVYCYTVLEHVADIEASIKEMIRVCKDGGVIFIQCPNYLFPYEGHYKLRLIPFAPRFIQKLWLRLKGRNNNFLNTINFVSEASLNRILWQYNVTMLRLYDPYLYNHRKSHDLLYFFTMIFAAHKDQNILLIKNAKS